MTRPLKVLLILSELGPGAPSVPLHAFRLLREEVRLFTLAFAPGFLEASYRELGPVRVLPPWRTSFIGRAARKLSMAAQHSSIRAFDPDVVYINSLAALEPATTLPVHSKPRLLHVHELDSYIEPILRTQPALLQGWPTRYVAVSTAVRSVLTERASIPASKIALIHDFAADEVATIGDFARRPTTAPSGRFVVGGAGSASWRKGIPLWLQAAAALRSLLDPGSFEFRWVGVPEGHDLDILRIQARKLGVEDLVTFISRTPEPYRHYLEFDAFAMTSWEDPCPLVVTENMALGTPVVCFAASGGPPEQVGDTGVIVPSFDPSAMAHALAVLARDEAHRRALGEAARVRARAFLASTQAPKLLDELRGLCR